MILLTGGDNGLDKPTDRDQRSQVFLNYPKNTLPLTKNPREILSEKQNPEKYPPKSLFIRN